MGLAQKIAEIRKELKYTEKRGRNSFHKYNYVMAEDIAASLGKTLADRGVIILRRNLTVQVLPNDITQITLDYVLHDIETGEEFVYASAGQGQDKGDKGIYKAFTGAFKYFFMQAFSMPLGDDPERHDESSEETDAPKQTMTKMTKEQGEEIVKLIAIAKADKKQILGYYGVGSIAECPYADLKRNLETKIRKGVPQDQKTEAANYPPIPPEAD